MYVKVTEERYGHAQLAALVEMNTAIILVLGGYIALNFGSLVGGPTAVALGVFCLFHSCTIARRGICYRIADRLGMVANWTLDDLDELEYARMRETGSVEVEVRPPSIED